MYIPQMPTWISELNYQLVEFVNEVTRNLNRGKQIDCLFMNLTMDFDNVWHSFRTHKLDHYGKTSKSNRWMESLIYNWSRQLVAVESAHSLMNQTRTFFLLTTYRKYNNNTRLFADDITLYLTIKSDTDEPHHRKTVITWLLRTRHGKCVFIWRIVMC